MKYNGEENLYAVSEITNGIVINKGTMIAKAREILKYLHESKLIIFEGPIPSRWRRHSSAG